MNFLIIRGGRKALGPLGSGGSRPGPAPRERPSPSPRPALGSAGGRRHRLGASSCLCVRLSVDLSEALAAGKDAGLEAQSPIWLGTSASWALGDPPALAARCASRSAPLRGARSPPGLLVTPLRIRGGRRQLGKARRGREWEREAAGAGPLRPGRAGDWPQCLPVRATRNARGLAGTRCLSVRLSLLPAFSL